MCVTEAGCVPFIQSLVSLGSSLSANKASTADHRSLVAREGRLAMVFSILFQVSVFHPSTGGSAWILQTPLFAPAVQCGEPWKKLHCTVEQGF